MDWPAWLVRAWQTFFAHEPPVPERIERLVALQAARYHNAHKAKGATDESHTDLLPNPASWDRVAEPEPGEDTPIVSIFQ